MNSYIVYLGFEDIFFNPNFIFMILFLMFFTIYFYILMRTPLGRKKDQFGTHIVVAISFIVALITVYGIYKGNTWFTSFNLDFLYEYGYVFGRFGDFLEYFGFMGMFFILGILLIASKILYGFHKFARANARNLRSFRTH